MLPLRDVVIFPHMTIPLLVGRAPSVDAIEEAAGARSRRLRHRPAAAGGGRARSRGPARRGHGGPRAPALPPPRRHACGCWSRGWCGPSSAASTGPRTPTGRGSSRSPSGSPASARDGSVRCASVVSSVQRVRAPERGASPTRCSPAPTTSPTRSRSATRWPRTCWSRCASSRRSSRSRTSRSGSSCSAGSSPPSCEILKLERKIEGQVRTPGAQEPEGVLSQRAAQGDPQGARVRQNEFAGEIEELLRQIKRGAHAEEVRERRRRRSWTVSARCPSCRPRPPWCATTWTGCVVPAVEGAHQGQPGSGRRRADPRRGPLRAREGQGAHRRVPGRAQALRQT